LAFAAIRALDSPLPVRGRQRIDQKQHAPSYLPGHGVELPNIALGWTTMLRARSRHRDTCSPIVEEANQGATSEGPD
jgi:hypothetical protein